MALNFNVHGFDVEIHGDPGLLPWIQSRLNCFPQPESNLPKLVFTSSIGTATDLGPPAECTRQGRTVYEFPDGKAVYLSEDHQIIIHQADQVQCVVDLTLGTVNTIARSNDVSILWALSHPFVTLPLVELLKERGLFHLHAAGVCHGSRGLLVAGTRGSGKSTLTLALLREGLDLLSDDTVFLTTRSGELRALGFPEPIEVNDRSLSFFPELSSCAASPQIGPWSKRPISAPNTFQANIVTECIPEVVVFPRVSNTPTSQLIRLSKLEAFLEFVPNVLLTGAGASQVHLQMLDQLTKTAECYRLETGTDLRTAARELVKLWK